jgi:hypothetical protein
METGVRIQIVKDQNMPNQNKYKIEVKWERWNAHEKKKEVIPLPEDKVTGITWNDLVKIIAEKGVAIAEKIRLHNHGQSGGTRMINRNELFLLWKDVEAYRRK